MRRRIAVLALGLVLFNTGIFLTQPLRAAIVLPLALVLPGRALVLNLLDRGGGRGLQRLALEVVCSIAIYPLVMLLLVSLSVTVRQTNVLLATDAVTAALMAVSISRLHRGSRAHAVTEESQNGRSALVWYGVLASAVAAVAATAVLAQAALPGKQDQGSVWLSLDARWAQISTVQVVEPLTVARVQIAIRNVNLTRKTYKLEAHLAGLAWKSRLVSVAAKGSWHGEITGRVPVSPCPNRLQIALIESSAPLRTLSVYFRTTRHQPPRCQS